MEQKKSHYVSLHHIDGNLYTIRRTHKLSDDCVVDVNTEYEAIAIIYFCNETWAAIPRLPKIFKCMDRKLLENDIIAAAEFIQT